MPTSHRQLPRGRGFVTVGLSNLQPNRCPNTLFAALRVGQCLPTFNLTYASRVPIAPAVGVFSFDQSLCAVMILCGFRVRLMLKNRALQRIHKVPLDRSSHCFRSVVVLYVMCSFPHIGFLRVFPFAGVLLLACQISLHPIGMRFRLLRGVMGDFQLRGYCSDSHLPGLSAVLFLSVVKPRCSLPFEHLLDPTRTVCHDVSVRQFRNRVAARRGALWGGGHLCCWEPVSVLSCHRSLFQWPPFELDVSWQFIKELLSSTRRSAP